MADQDIERVCDRSADAVRWELLPCCDLHGRNCEPPGDLCCDWCTEKAHRMGDSARGFHPVDGSKCANPDLSGTEIGGVKP